MKHLKTKSAKEENSTWSKFPESTICQLFPSYASGAIQTWGNPKDINANLKDFDIDALNKAFTSNKYTKYNFGMYGEFDNSPAIGQVIPRFGGFTYVVSPNRQGYHYDYEDPPKAKEQHLYLRGEFYAIEYTPEGIQCILDQLEELLSNFSIVKWFRNGLQSIEVTIISQSDVSKKSKYIYDFPLGFVKK